MAKARILIVEGVITQHHNVNALLTAHDWHVISSAASINMLSIFQDRRPSLVIIEHSGQQIHDGLKSVHQIRSVNKTIPIILIVNKSSEELAIEALRLGVSNYFKPPLIPETLVASVEHCLKNIPAEAASKCCSGALEELTGSESLVGRSQSIMKIKDTIYKTAKTDSNVLITGETGTGKELVAELLHINSKRSNKGMVCINCAAIPDSLLESELFGYDKGAFTGAQTARQGKLEQADGGTIFMDEIGDLSAQSQAKILRAIETKEVEHLGGRGTLPVDIRVIVATNQPLEKMVSEGQFRQDLFFRINVARFHLTPLRERKEDIPLLCEHFIQAFNSQFGVHVSGVSEQVMEYLLHYTWLGNVRELRNVLEAAFINHPGRLIEIDDLPEAFRKLVAESTCQKSSPENECDKVLAALLSTKWNKSKAAKKLHWSRMTLYRKMEKYQIKENKVTQPALADIV